MWQISNADLATFITYFMLGLVAGPILSLILTLILQILRNIFYVPFVRKRLFDKAVAQGHIVKAKLVSRTDIMDPGENGMRFTGKRRCVYKYEWNGRKYTYRSITSGIVTDELTLYFTKHPSTASTQNEVGCRDLRWFPTFIWISLIAAVVIGIMGVYYYGGQK